MAEISGDATRRPPQDPGNAMRTVAERGRELAAKIAPRSGKDEGCSG